MTGRGRPPRLEVGDIRTIDRPRVLVREPAATMLVLGSSQDSSLVTSRFQGVVVARRGGGGAVLVIPDATIWVDAWIPTTSSLHRTDLGQAMVVVGDRWASALRSCGVEDAAVWPAAGGASRSEVCFAGVGPGEVLVDDRKLVGLTAWRAREGTLVQAALYRSLDRSLPDLLQLSKRARTAAHEALEKRATDLEALGSLTVRGTHVASSLVDALASIDPRTDTMVRSVPPSVLAD